MKISVVVTTYRERGLETVLGALWHQTRWPDEVIAVCDEILPELAMGPFYAAMPGRPRPLTVRSLPFPHRTYGVAVPQNYGCDMASGELIVLLTDCSWVPPRFVEAHAELAAEFSLVAGGAREHGEESFSAWPPDTCTCEGLVHPWPVSQDLHPQAWQACRGSGMSFSKALFDKIGGFDERLDGANGCNDMLFALRCQLSDPRDIVVTTRPDLVVHHTKRHHGGKLRTRAGNEQIVSDIIKYHLMDPAYRIDRGGSE